MILKEKGTDLFFPLPFGGKTVFDQKTNLSPFESR
jgi:hypothetical protein